MRAGILMGFLSNVSATNVYAPDANILVEGDSIADGLEIRLNAATNDIPYLNKLSFVDNAVWGNVFDQVISRIDSMSGATQYHIVCIVLGHNDCNAMYFDGRSESYVRSYAQTKLAELYNILKTKTSFVELYYLTIPKYRDTPQPQEVVQNWFDDEIVSFAASKTDMHIVPGNIIIDGTIDYYFADVVHPSDAGNLLLAGGFANEMKKLRHVNVTPTFTSAEVGTFNNKIIEVTCSFDIYKIFPSISDFVLGGTTSQITAISSVLNKLYLTLNQEPLYSSTITLSYTKGTNKLKDIYLNEYPSVNGYSITNNLQNNTEPVLVSVEIGSFSEDVIFLQYSERLDETKIPSTNDYSVSGITGNPSISTVEVVNDTVRLQLSANAAFGDVPLLSYTSGVNKIQDTGGNVSGNFTNQTVTNNVDTGFEYETTQLIAAMTSAPTVADQEAINIFIKALKDNAIWSELDRLYVYASHTNSNEEALIDWIHPTGTKASLVGSPTYTAKQGFSGAGGINTKYIPSSHSNKYTINSASFGCYRRVYTSGFLGRGVTKPTSLCTNVYNTASTILSFSINNGAGLGTTPVLVGKEIGLVATVRRNSSQCIYHANGNEYVTSQNSSASLINLEYYEGLVNNNGANGTDGTDEISMTFIGSGLSESKLNIFRTAFEALMDYYGKGIL